MKKLILFLLLFCAIIFKIFSQNLDIKFERISINEGLSLSSIYCIMQDSKGFMWFGTEDGLNKYDGYDFTIFRPDIQKSNSISNKWIHNIFEDKKNNLWIVTDFQLNKFNPETETFKIYNSNRNDKSSISNNFINVIFEDKKGNLWFGTKNGLNKYKPEKDNFTRFVYDKKNKNCMSDNFINIIFEDKKDNLWFGTKNGLNLFNVKTSKFINFYNKPEDKKSVSNNNIQSIFEDSEGNIWVGTLNGLNIYDRKNNNFIRYFHDKNNKKTVSDNIIRSINEDSKKNIWIGTDTGFDKFDKSANTFKNIINDNQRKSNSAVEIKRPFFEDKNGILWFGTFGAGLFRLDLKTEKLNNYLHNHLNEKSISENGINSIMQDKYGVLWFGTFGAGLNKYDPLSQKFMLFRNQPENKNSLSDNFIWSIWEDKDEEVWIGTNSHGISKYNMKTEKFTHYTHDKNNKNSLSNNTVREIFQDSKGIIWIGTHGGGLNKFDKKTSKFKHYLSIPNDTNTITSNSVRVVYEDSKNNLWIGTTAGLNKFNPKTETFKRYVHNPNDNNSLSSNFIYSAICEDNNGFLWIGTFEGGLNKFDPKTEKFIRYKNIPENKNSIINDRIRSVERGKNSTLWIATNGGLEHLDINSEIFTHYTTFDGLPNNTLYGILPDKKGNIWITTNDGLSKFNPEDKTFVNFNVSSGLQSKEFNGGAFHAGKSGYLYAAGVQGLNIFKPENIIYNTIPPDLVISKFQIYMEKVKVLPLNYINENNDKNLLILKDNEYFLEKSITYTDEIILDYSEKVISFEFSALHFSNSEENKYAYRLRNFEKEWNLSEKRRFVTYTNLNPGEYYFEVKSANVDGIWNNKIKTIKIIVTPPFWNTKWFYAGLILFSVFSLSLIIKIRERKLRYEKNLLEQNVKQRTEEILLQKELIEDAHREITHSINYASQIQKAILGNPDFIVSKFPEAFIYLNPQSAVSGDFFWYSEIEHYQIIIAVDCTGHGVPGAFMTMIGYGFLDDIIKKENIIMPDKILHQLDLRITNRLIKQKSGIKVNDGMDLSVITVNNKDKKLYFSAAKNSLLMLKNGELTKISGSKFEIGGEPVRRGLVKKFKLETFEVRKNDIFYIFSDGFQDQFGGKSGRKYMAKRFRDLIFQISKFPLSQQKIKLQLEFELWKNNYEQTDDILVIGIKPF